MNEDKRILTVYDEKGKPVTVQVLFTFLIPDQNRRYIVYTFDLDKKVENDSVDVLISEVDVETYKIKEIPESDIQMVIDYYQQIKRTLIV